MNLYIPIILGTAREGRESGKIANYVLSEIKKRAEIETEIIDVRDYRLPVTDNSEETDVAKRWGEIAKKADGFIIVTPEYNHGYPGELKMFLDMIYDQYARKPVAICGVSNGILGGARMGEQLKLVLLEFHMMPIGAVYFAKIKSLFENGKITDESYYQPRLEKMLNELVWWAGALKSAKKNNV